MTEPRRIDIAEFREIGFLQEVNRLFFHPHGLALEIVTEEECEACGGHGRPAPRSAGEQTPPCEVCHGTGQVERLGGVWDYRDDPEGVMFGLPMKIDTDKVKRVKREYQKHEGPRKSLLKSDFPIQLPGQELE